MTRSCRRVSAILGRFCSIVLVTFGFSQAALAQVFDMREGVTEISQRVQNLHHISLGVCVVVGIVVFGAMFYTMYAHRRSKHPVPAKFHESTPVEIIWTIIPTLILIGMAVPATTALIDIEDNSDPDLTVLVTASQWKWHYQYVEADIGFFSNLATPQDAINNLIEKEETYILDVDNPLVIPTNQKVRFLMTSGDVIHSWWVPDFASSRMPCRASSTKHGRASTCPASTAGSARNCAA